jgi:hypothetical protein
MGGIYALYAESAQARKEWKDKLEEALGMRKVVQESNKVRFREHEIGRFLNASIIGIRN